MDKAFELKDKMDLFIGWCDWRMNRQIIYFFFHWLRKKHALKSFLCNLSNMGKILRTPDNFIMGSFAWCGTPQGRSYWSRMRIKWMGALSKHDIYTHDEQEIN